VELSGVTHMNIAFNMSKWCDTHACLIQHVCSGVTDVSSALSSAEFSSDLRGRGLKDAQEYRDQGHSSSRRTFSHPAAGRLGLMANEVCARERVRGCVCMYGMCGVCV